MATPSIVIDVATGQVLEQDQATAVWFPASTTKLMTAYVALDAVRKGRITLDTPLVVSERATEQAPSKMGFRAGQQVTLRNALVMLMVKSANDIAVTIAEGVSGSIEAFAGEMNQASAAIGMKESYWVNPNGLPDDRQVSSARDLALLGRALLVDFPESADLYHIGAFRIGRRIMPTHNGLLKQYPGADGMKTGFTCPAGYNLVASATRGSKKLITVVLGAPSGAARTLRTAALFDRAFQGAQPQGLASELPGPGVGPAPDQRDKICVRHGKAHKQYVAEFEDAPIQMLGDSAQKSGEGHLNAQPLAFDPVLVHTGPIEGYAGPVAKPRDPKLAVGADEPGGPQLVPAPLAEPGKLTVWGAGGRAFAAAAGQDDAEEPHGKSGKHKAKGKGHHHDSAKAQDSAESGDDSEPAKGKPRKHGPGKAKHHSSRSTAAAGGSRVAEAR
ncbi:penicillin-binding protein [Methylocystis bryophila]|nr:penicillin-binding protein [Methylocystis bryophila]